MPGGSFAGLRGCSTPEGIGAEIGRSARARSLARPGAQRPRASERRSGAADLQIPPPGSRCSTPEGIGAEIGRGAPGRLVAPAVPVLNARGHRSGDRVRPHGAYRSVDYGAQRPRASERRSGAQHPHVGLALLRCSTPEGIGAEIGRCSGTCGGWGLLPCAQRPRASERRSGASCISLAHWSIECSTPEGIGAEIGRDGRPRRARVRRVLNARGHRSGDREKPAAKPVDWAGCATPEGIGAEIGDPVVVGLRAYAEVLNARGHRSGDRGPRRPCRARSRRAQRPRASERRSDCSSSTRCSSCHRRSARRSLHRNRPRAVLNARGHRSGDRPRSDSRKARTCGAQRPRASERRSGQVRAACRGAIGCSTPEGIGAEIGE